MAAIVGVFVGVKAKSARTAWARATKRRTAAGTVASSPEAASPDSGRPNGGTAYSCSPDRRSRTRLVARIVSPGDTSSRVATTGAAATTCSKLSSTTRRRLSRTNAVRRSVIGPRLPSRRPNDRAIAEATSAESRTGARPTNQTPSGKA